MFRSSEEAKAHGKSIAPSSVGGAFTIVRHDWGTTGWDKGIINIAEYRIRANGQLMTNDIVVMRFKYSMRTKMWHEVDSNGNPCTVLRVKEYAQSCRHTINSLYAEIVEYSRKKNIECPPQSAVVSIWNSDYKSDFSLLVIIMIADILQTSIDDLVVRL